MSDIENRLQELERDMIFVRSNTDNTTRAVEKILTNHLPHIENEIGEIKTSVSGFHEALTTCLQGVEERLSGMGSLLEGFKERLENKNRLFNLSLALIGIVMAVIMGLLGILLVMHLR